MTGTHGSGIHNPAMSNFVSQVAFVDPEGKQKRLTRQNNGEDFTRFLHSFGALGLVYQMSMDIMDEFAVKKCIYKDVPFDKLFQQKEFDFMNYYNDYVTFFTDWKEEKMSSLWISERIYAESKQEYKEMIDLPWQDVCEEELFSGVRVYSQHPAPEMSEKIPTTGSGIGMWYDKIYYFPPDGLPNMAGAEIASEFYVEYHLLKEVVEELYAKREIWGAHLAAFSEFRPLEQDHIPLSPGKNQQVYSVHFTWHHDFDGVYQSVKEVQKILKKFDYRVHWGKFFHPEPDFALFATFEDDLELLKAKIDAYENNKFKNCWVERILYGYDECTLDSNYERNLQRMHAKYGKD